MVLHRTAVLPAHNYQVPGIEFHPELRRSARLVPKQMITPVTLPFVRAASRMMWRHPPQGVEVLTLASGVKVRLHRPPTGSGPGPALLWIHGGGYVIGDAAQDDVLCRRFAAVAPASSRSSSSVRAYCRTRDTHLAGSQYCT